MSGHSKWHNIQKTKGAADAKRSAAFTKIAKEIIVAVKEGGGSGDPANNSRLATVIAKAKAVNMPNDNIKRTIDKALGAGNTENFEAVTYEGYGPGGVAVIVDALTDNRQRTAPEVRHAFDKCNGNLGAQGCVSWSFDRKGVIVIDNEDQELDEDTVMMDALEAGAADFEADGMVMEVRCEPDDFNTVVKALEDNIFLMDQLTTILDEDGAETVIAQVFKGLEWHKTAESDMAYKCYCSRQRVERALLSLGADELEGILRDQGSCHMTCQFCDAVYEFDRQQLEQLIADARKN